MTETYSKQAIHSVLNSEMGFCKFLAANDTKATNSHQSGILISKSAENMLFPGHQLQNESIAKRLVKIKWQDDLETESCFTYYKSKNELRITRFGKGFPFINPKFTGALFVFTKQGEDDYQGYFLGSDAEIEEFLNAFGIGATETNSLIDRGRIRPETSETQAIKEFIENLGGEFPASEVMSAAAREIENNVYNHKEYIISNPDSKIISWTNMEYAIFRALEYARYGDIITRGFTSVDKFVKMANAVLNRRKSRAGRSLEHHLAAIFDGNGIDYSAQPVTEGNKKPDFLFPSAKAYHTSDFPADSIISLAAKTTCKDRWRQVLNEADRLRDKVKYLCTLQQGISEAQMDEMQREKVILVVPKQYIIHYPQSCRDRIWTVHKFVGYVKEIEEEAKNSGKYFYLNS